MDIISHALWTNVVYLKAQKRARLWAVLFGVAPDLVSFGPFFAEELVARGLRFGPPQFAGLAFKYISTAYHFTHSLVIFAAVFALVWLIRRTPYLPLAGWGLHIAIDIFSHSRAFFPTPFLFPLSKFNVNAISWADPRFLLVNLTALAIAYLIIFFKRIPR